MKRTIFPLIALALILAGSSSTAQVRLAKSVISAGAVDAAGPDMRLRGTVGQTFIGMSSNAETDAQLGFWYQVPIITTAIREIPGYPEEGSSLLGEVYPNPCSYEARVPVNLVKGMQANAYLLDSRGQKAALVHRGWLAPGRYELVFETRGLAPGHYTLVVEAGEIMAVRSLIVQK